MAQVSDSADQDPTLTNPSEQPEEGKKHFLLSTFKDKAIGAVQKLVTKVKKGSVESEEQSGKEQTINDLENSSSEGQKEGGSTGTDEVKEAQNGSGHQVSFEGSTKSENEKLRPFARGIAESDSFTATPFIATPTSYGEPHTTIEDVMPPPVIEPTSVSELGEELSSNLGNIPEARDEEKAAAKEVQEGGPDSDINEGFKDTFQQKDLQAIDGLPKPRGFDVGNESVVKSGDLGFVKSQGLFDQAASRETEGNAEGTSKGGEREFPVDGAICGTEQDNEIPHPPGSVADFKDSMFFSSALHDLKPNEPKAEEAMKAGEIGTFSRESDPEANKSSGREGEKSHAPGSMAEFKDSMFSSNVAHDLKPNEPKAEEAKKAGEVGTFSREFDPEPNKSSGREGEKAHAPGSIAEFKDSMFSSNAAHDLKPNEPNAEEAKRAGEIGTFSREINPEAKQSSGTDGDTGSSQHHPAIQNDLHENMFSSAMAGDLKPSQTDTSIVMNRGTESSSPTDGLSKESEFERNTNFHDAPKELPPPALAGEGVEDRDGSSAGMGGSSGHDSKSITAEEEAENYFDTFSDDEALASQRSLDSDFGKDFNPEASTEYREQRDALNESADFRIEASVNDEKASKETGADSHVTGGGPTPASTLRSVVNSVGSQAGFASAPALSSEAQAAAEQNANGSSISDNVSTWISKAIGVLLPDEQEGEPTKSDAHR